MDGIPLDDFIFRVFGQVSLVVANFAVRKVLTVYGNIPSSLVYLIVVVNLADCAHVQCLFRRLEGARQPSHLIVEWHPDLVYRMDFLRCGAAGPHRSGLSDHP